MTRNISAADIFSEDFAAAFAKASESLAQMANAANPRPSVRRLVNELEHNVSVQLYQDRPYTFALVSVVYQEVEYTNFGFSKVTYPDEFDPETGTDIAIRRALYKIAYRILGRPLHNQTNEPA